MKKINSLSTLCLLLLLGITSVVHGHNPARQSPLWSPFGGHDGSNWQASDGYKNDDWIFGCHWSGQREIGRASCRERGPPSLGLAAILMRSAGTGPGVPEVGRATG